MARVTAGCCATARGFWRLLIWLAVAFIFLSVESYLVGGGQPEIPARGLDDRTLFWTTILAHVVGTIILLVLVADATVLTWRFIGILKGGRTIYPRSTVERFAAELGPELQAVAAEPIAADVSARTRAAPRRSTRCSTTGSTRGCSPSTPRRSAL